MNKYLPRLFTPKLKRLGVSQRKNIELSQTRPSLNIIHSCTQIYERLLKAGHLGV